MQALLIDDGATGFVTCLDASGHSTTGVEVRGLASSLELANSTIIDAAAPGSNPPDRDPHHDIAHTWTVCAVHAHHGAAVKISKSILRGSYTGLAASDSGTLAVVQSTMLWDNMWHGAVAARGAEMRLQDCSCQAAEVEQRTGVQADGAGTTLALDTCTLAGNSECGVMACSLAAVTVHRCRSHGNGKAGFVAQVRLYTDLMRRYLKLQCSVRVTFVRQV